MGYRELIESLRKDGDENINQMWIDVKAEAEKINNETSERIKELSKKYQTKRDTAVQQQEESILAEAKNRSRIIKLTAERIISDRLFPLAESVLGDLRNTRYKEVFKLLVKELPDKSWEEVRVNPQDVRIAREHFPDVIVTPDEHISGGLVVLREEGRIRITNTFKKRLEKAWEDLLPLLFSTLYEEISDHEASSQS